jgi:hypothetical protein
MDENDERKSALILLGLAEMIVRRELHVRMWKLKQVKTEKEIKDLKITLLKVARRALKEYDPRLQVLPGTYATLEVVTRLNEIVGWRKIDQSPEAN